MKQSLHSLGIAFVALSLMVGCGRDKKKMRVEKEMEMGMMQDMDLANIAPEEDFFDESEMGMSDLDDLEQFAFMDENLRDDNQEIPSDEALAQGLDAQNDDFFAYAPLASNPDNLQFKPIQFGYNSSKLADDQASALTENIELAKQAVEQGKNIEIRGFRDQLGNPIHNMKLSQNAANEVKKEMIAQGIPEDKIIALGCGQENPLVSSNATDKASRIQELAPNRRVEISIS